MDDDNEKPNISDWPDYVLLRIFERLPLKSLAACGSTCSNWRRIAADSTLWPRRLEFDRFQNITDIAGLLRVGGGNLEMISLRLFTEMNPMFEAIALHCCNLRGLELDHCPSPSEISMESLSRVSDGCRKLECFALRNMTVDDEYMNAFMEAAESFPRLSHVVLYKCFGVSASAIEGVADRLPNLSHLDVEHVRLSPQSLETIAHRTGSTLKAFYCTVPTMENLKIFQSFEKLEAIGIDVVSPTIRPSHDVIGELTRFSNLRVLRLSNVSAPVQVRRLLTREGSFSKLEHLSFLNCAPMSQPHLCEILRTNPNLRHLCLDFRLTDSTIEEIARSCKSLNFVYFKVTPDAHCSSLHKLDCDEMPNLSYLYIDDSRNIFPAFLDRLVEKKPVLRVICYGRTFFHHPKDQPILKRVMNEILLFNPYLDFFPIR